MVNADRTPPDCPGGHDGMPESDAGRHLQNQLEILIQDFRRST